MHRARYRSTRARDQGGFTLIELLVVIIILGVLSSVVVFAVRGAGDKGKAAALATDVQTIKTAQEAYCAKNGQYADGAELVASKFLSEAPTLHNVAPTGGGTCKGSGDLSKSGFAITCGDSESCSTMTVGSATDTTTLTGNRAALAASPLNANVFETLILLSPTYTLEPKLALSWELIPASTARTTAGGSALPHPYAGVDTWRFRLRPNVTFHNGARMDATAVKLGLFDRTLGNPFAGGGIKAGGPANSLSTAQVESAQVVEDTCTTTTNCTIDFTPTVQNLRVPQQIVHPTYGVQAPGTVAGSKPGGGFEAVGTGPFTFETYQQGVSLTTVRNPGYWGTPALLKRMVFKFIPDATVRRQALQAGDLDFIYDVPRPDVGLVQSSGLKVAKSQVGTYQAMYLNKNPAPAYTQGSGCEANTGENGCHDLLADVSVRKAINFAIDRGALVNGPLAGQATTDQTFVAPLALAPYQSMIAGYPFSLSTANSLLDGAGWTSPRAADGTRRRADGRTLEITMISGFPNSSDNEPLPDYLKGVLATIGVRLNIVKTPSIYTPRLQSGQADLWLEQGNQNDANPAFISFVLYTGAGFNTTSAYPPRFAPAPTFPLFNTEILKTFSEPNLDTVRLETAKAFKDAIENAAVLAPLAGLFRIYGMNNKVQGFVAHPAFLHVQWESVAKVG